MTRPQVNRPILSLTTAAIFIASIVGVVLVADNALAQASKAKKGKTETTPSVSVSVPLVCSNFRNTSRQGNLLASDRMDFRDRFATMETITGWVEGVRPSTGATERLNLANARTGPTRNSPSGAVAQFGVDPNETDVARDVIGFGIGDYGLKFKGTNLPPTGEPIMLKVSASQPWEAKVRNSADVLNLTAFNITICGKPSAVVCQRVRTDIADRFAAQSQITRLSAPGRLTSVQGSVSVASVGTIRGANSQFTARPNRPELQSIFGVDSLGGSLVKVGVVSQNATGPFNYQGGVKPLAVGDTVRPGDYLVTLTTWPGNGGTAEPSRPAITSNLELCFAR
jgi:hypothetical protein